MPSAPEDKYRKTVSARDIAERLLVNFDVNELLLWPPNLFAFTSSTLSLTSAYQLVISPPRGRRWPPDREEVSNWFEGRINIGNQWLRDLAIDWQLATAESSVESVLDGNHYVTRFRRELENLDLREYVAGSAADKKEWWCTFVRTAGTEWSNNLSELDDSLFELIHGENEPSRPDPRRAEKLFDLLLGTTPMAVVASWLTLYPLLSEGSSVSSLLCNSDECTGDEMETNWRYAQAIITLHAIADEACVVWGINQEGDKEGYGGKARGFAEEMLLNSGTMATIGSERCRVLPKRHNPNVGITLRSLSSNLAFHRSSIDVVWRQAASNPLSEHLENEMKLKSCDQPDTSSSFTFSVLLLPWPMQIHAGDFKEYRKKRGMDENAELPVILDESRYGFFYYSPPAASAFAAKAVDEMLEAAEAEGPVSMLIMPESALESASVAEIEYVLKERAKPERAVSIFIAGVREEPKLAYFARNSVICRTIRIEKQRPIMGNTYTYDEEETGQRAKTDRTKQYKHHRWKLDENQIKQYGLSTVLDPKKEWWEAIKVERRRVSFVNVGNRLTICPLICEDLARQDPIADLIRHVGPNLVVTILMDGPQKADRWSSRYAGVLSEDPGSAVITLSSYGMVRRWSTPYRHLSNVVALWNDGKSPAREIELAQGAEGILLRLRVDSECEPIADGRIEMFATAKISLADVIQVYRDR